jgi:tripartite-type tricarboxylate transporter receptor subunit TctC
MLGLAAAACFNAVGARAQDYPNRTIRIVVPYAPGGGVSVVGQIIGAKLQELTRQPVVIDNRPGAGGNVGADAVAKAAPDGYTVLLHTSAMAVVGTLYRKLAFDPVKDFAPITMVISTHFVIGGSPRNPATSLRQLVAQARANPGKLNYASSGPGSTLHLFAEMFKDAAGVDIVHVPYRGDAPVAADLMAGVLGVAFVSSNVAIPLIQTGKLRALAVPSRRRIAVLPDVPTMAESGYPDFDLQPWTALFGPAGLDTTIVSSLNGALKDILAEPDVVERLSQLSMTPAAGSPEALSRMIEKSITLWKGVAAKAKIVVE